MDKLIAENVALAKRVEDSEDEVRVLRDELSHIADALGVAPYGGCYEQAEVLERAKALAKGLEELESLMADWHEALMAQRRLRVTAFEAFDAMNDRLKSEAFKVAERRAGRAS